MDGQESGWEAGRGPLGLALGQLTLSWGAKGNLVRVYFASLDIWDTWRAAAVRFWRLPVLSV